MFDGFTLPSEGLADWSRQLIDAEARAVAAIVALVETPFDHEVLAGHYTLAGSPGRTPPTTTSVPMEPRSTRSRGSIRFRASSTPVTTSVLPRPSILRITRSSEAARRLSFMAAWSGRRRSNGSAEGYVQLRTRRRSVRRVRRKRHAVAWIPLARSPSWSAFQKPGSRWSMACVIDIASSDGVERSSSPARSPSVRRRRRRRISPSS